jgi:hypothetical protein
MEAERGSSEKFCIYFFLLTGGVGGGLHLHTLLATHSKSVFLLDYAENGRWKLKAGILRSKLEQRDRTTQPKVLSAKPT